MRPHDPMSGSAIELGMATHIGLVRRSMQDVAVAQRLHGGSSTLIAVADGIGGAPAGEVASDIAARALVDVLEMSRWDVPETMERTMAAAVSAANLAVAESAAEHAAFAGMGTTLTAILIAGAFCVVGHVGDSRAYLLRDGTLEQLTRDHTQADDAFGGVEMDPRGRHVLTRAVGLQREVQSDTSAFELRSGDVALVATDGLHGAVGAGRIAEVLAGSDLRTAMAALIDTALAAGGPDNIAVAGAKVVPRSAADETGG